MTQNDRVPPKRGEWFYFAAGMIIPALFVLISYIVIEVWPFGDGTVLIIDSIHQYLPFYTDFHEKLVHHQSLFYSFSGGFGFDFWATYAYYLASPLNFLIALVPVGHVCDFMDFLILFKIGLCGGIFSWYLHKRDPNSGWAPIVFGTMFALSNFMTGYYFNLMWLDSIALLPLIMMGIEKIAKGRRPVMYTLSLFAALWCNYYIGFMLCFFSVLYLIVCLVNTRKLTPKKAGRRILTFGYSSVLAGGMASVVLLPAYLSLRLSENMTGSSFPAKIKFYTNFIDMMVSHAVYQHPINIADTQVGLNVYCGSMAAGLVILYVLDRKIPLRERLGKLLLAGFLLLSFAANVLNFIWHGFHQQNGLPNRFAFIYIVVILVMGFDALRHLKDQPPVNVAAAALIPPAFMLTVIAAGRGGEEYGGYAWLSPVILACYAVILLLMTHYRKYYKLILNVLLAAMFIEAGGHCIYGYIYDENVPRQTYIDDQTSWRNMVAAKGETDFFRSEYDSQRMRNVSMFAGAYSTVMFNSTMMEQVTDFCDRIGMEARTNKNGYIGLTGLMNDIFGIRYVLSTYAKGDQLYGFEKVDADDHLSVFRNDDALSLGFLCDPQIRDWELELKDPVSNQNLFIMLATSLPGIFQESERLIESDETFTVEIPEDSSVYLYLKARADKVELETPEYHRTYNTYTDHLYCLNGTKEDRTAKITITVKGGGSQTVYLYTCADEALKSAAEELGRSQLENVSVNGNKVSGSIDADRDGILLMTVPYQKGWHVSVDGETKEPLEIGNMFNGIELTAGSHQISMSFTPSGFFAGLVLSLVCAAVFLASTVFARVAEIPEEEETMEIEYSKAANSFRPGIFSLLNEKKEELEAQGKVIYNLSVGTPEYETDPGIMKAVSDAALDPKNYRYALKDLPELTASMQDFYRERFGVSLEPEEIMSVYGSQEGIAHIAWTVCDPGDLVLVPNPGYPIFKIGPTLCGAETREYPLRAENDYLPDLNDIPEDVAWEARMMIVSYPGNPLGKAAPESFYRELIAFAKKYNIFIVHDNAYADIIFGDREGKSFLSYEGAKEVGAEFYSLSKTFNYTGARMSFLLGNKEFISKFRTIRSQIDYGTFLPVQYGAIKALHKPLEEAKLQSALYEEKARTLSEGLTSIGWPVPMSEGTMFLWAPLPKGYHDSEQFCMELMETSGVICTPGSSFGSLGEGYVRFALVEDPDTLREAVESIRQSGIIKEPVFEGEQI